MKRQKKQRHPIAGQRWWEKLLDRATFEENFFWSMFLLIAYTAIMFFGVFLLSNILEWFVVSDLFFYAWSSIFPIVALAAMLNPWATGWGFWKSRKLQKSIPDHICQHGDQTYDELVHHCMPIKIHLGMDDALETLLREHKLVLYTDEQGTQRYRLATQEDQDLWWKTFLLENGETLSPEELQKILSLDCRHYSDGLLIWLCVGGQDEYWMGKTEQEDSNEQAIWLQSDDLPYCEFSSFENLIQAKVFRGKSMIEVWDDVEFLSIEGMSVRDWMHLQWSYGKL